MAINKIRIGITGQSGFIGSHLYNFFSIHDAVQCIPFEDVFFQNENDLNSFVKECDVIIHLAALNRHNDPSVIYKTNIELVQKLINAMNEVKVTPHVLFSSSTQEERDNLYGKSKIIGRKMLMDWAEINDALFTGMVIPNVFGPFGKPFYNSVVATFAYQLTHNEQPQIDVDGEMKLIYVGELTDLIWHEIQQKRSNFTYEIPYSKKCTVSEILQKLQNFKKDYFENGIFPDLGDTFDRNLFNTFACYIDQSSYFPRNLVLHSDTRGTFVEIAKEKGGGQSSFSTTNPGITRGNHFHTRKAERFAVIKGKAKIELRLIGVEDKLTFIIDGDMQPGYVDMPIWFTHNITNIGNDELYTIFWISEHYNPDDPDTFFENV